MPKRSTMTAPRLYEKAFYPHRSPRSDEYEAGVFAALRFRFEGIRVVCSDPEGTAASDAFFAGVDEGHFLWRQHLAELGADEATGGATL